MPFLLAKAVALSPDSRNSRSASRASASVQRFARPLPALSLCSDIVPRQSRQRTRRQAYAGRGWATPLSWCAPRLTALSGSMPIVRDGGFLYWPDMGPAPGLGLESSRLDECIEEINRRHITGVFGSSVWGFYESDLNVMARVPHVDAIWFWDV